MSGVGSWLLKPALALAVGLLILVGSTPTADAYTGWHFRTKPIGAFKIGIKGADLQIPKGCFLTIGVNYRHHAPLDYNRPGIKGARVGTDCVGPWHGLNPFRFCNRKIGISFYDAANHRYYKWKSKVASNCRSNNLWEMPSSVYGYFGKACARLYLSGKRVKTTCIPVHG